MASSPTAGTGPPPPPLRTDTAAFLRCLKAHADASAAACYDSDVSKTECDVAVEKLFSWSEEVFVSRAPGRMDVMVRPGR
jgi:hypothetical protein